jgi:hypothetical protein
MFRKVLLLRVVVILFGDFIFFWGSLSGDSMYRQTAIRWGR